MLAFCFFGIKVQKVQAQVKWGKSELTNFIAERTLYEVKNSEKVVQLIGKVFFNKEDQELRCDRAIFYDEQDLTIFEGHVFYQDSSRSLRCEYFEYYSEPERELARGNVELVVDEKKIYADEISYEVFHEKVFATNNVRFIDSENDIILTSDKLSYDRISQVALVEIDPKLVKLNSQGKPETTIESRIFTYYDSTKVAIAEDSVIITHNKVIGQTNLAEFYQKDNRIVMKNNPRIFQNNNEMQAEQIEMMFQNDSLKQVFLDGKGLMISNFMIDSTLTTDRLTGAAIWIDMDDDSVRHILVKGQATSIYHLIEENEVQGKNQVMGDELSIDFDKGLVDNVKVIGTPEVSRGRFYPPDAKIRPIK